MIYLLDEVEVLKMKCEKTILIAEDDRESNENIAYFLQNKFKKVLSAYDGIEAWNMYNEELPDIIITDIEMPKMNGLKLIQKIRLHNKSIPIIILTSYSNPHYLFDAIPLKLEDYLLKPLTYSKLNALLEKLENSQQEGKTILVLDAQSTTLYDFDMKIVKIKNDQIRLANLEITLLELFLANSDKIVYYEEAEEALYGSQMKSRNALKIVVSNLRKKIPTIEIRAIPKIGYRLV